MARPSNRQRKIERLLSGTAAAAALLYATGAAEVVAQITNDAFQGAPTAGSGVTVNRLFWRDEITTTGTSGIVTWTPNDTTGTGPINFLPQGRTGEFYGPAGFTILNVVMPSDTGRAISLNGLVNTRVGGPNGAIGGNVWFYSPGGIVVGGTARFNVGGLLLSAAAIPTAGGTFDPNNVSFAATPGSTSAIDISQLIGSTTETQIRAADYIALIAPRIVQAGSIRADGQIAFIAAEAGTLNMPVGGGLFSIEVSTGTSATGNAIDHRPTASTGGSASTNAASDPRRLYMVTVAANDAVSILLGGNVGFDAASSAALDGNAIVLSAGRNIVAGEIQHDMAPIGTASNIYLGVNTVNPNITSHLIADASGDAVVQSFEDTMQFAGNVTLYADNRAAMVTVDAPVGSDASPGHITVAGDVLVQSARNGRTAGTAEVVASRIGSMTIGGSLTVRADADATLRGDSGVAAATAGTARIIVNGNRINASGPVTVSATAIAGAAGVATGGTASLSSALAGVNSPAGVSVIADAFGGDNASGAGGLGQGGTASASVRGFTMTVGNSGSQADFIVRANGTGGAGSTAGGQGRGGTTSIEAINGGTLVVSRSLLGSADGFGGQVSSTTGGSAGEGTGGTLTLAMSTNDASPSIATGSSIQLTANGTGGTPTSCSIGCVGTVGGIGRGGTASMTLGAGSIDAPSLEILADGTGGAGATISGAATALSAGGAGIGGSASATIATGDENPFRVPYFRLSGSASGGSGGDGLAGANGGAGGAATSGSAALTIATDRAFSFTTGTVMVETTAYGGRGGDSETGAAGDGGSANGAGVASITVQPGAILRAATVQASATSYGGNGGNHFGVGTPDSRGGDATGGSAAITASGGELSAVSLFAGAQGYSGAGGSGAGEAPGIGGNGRGGNATISVVGGAVVTAQQLYVDATGSADYASRNRVGGTGTGGGAELVVDGGGVTIAGSSAAALDIRADGVGGDGFEVGGAGNGGTAPGATLTVRNSGTINAGDATVSVSAQGLGGVGDVSGGAGRGGAAGVTLQSEAALTTSGAGSGLTITALGIGGDAGIAGGAATGGTASLNFVSGVIDTPGVVQLNAGAVGGGSLGRTGGSGGVATGGLAELTLGSAEGGSGSLPQLNAGAVSISAAALGGGGVTTFCEGSDCPEPTGTPGGDAQGGTALAIFYQGAIAAGSLDAVATGTGGVGLPGLRTTPSGQALDGGLGGAGTGGTARVTLAGAEFEAAPITVSADGIGGAGGGSVTSVPGLATRTGGDGGTGTGGTAEFLATSGTISGSTLLVHASGLGGDGGQTQTIDPPPSGGPGGVAALSGGDGGAGTGGIARIASSGSGQIGFSELTVEANGQGGAGGAHSGTSVPNVSGSGTGGLAEIAATGGAITAITATVRADGQYGAAGASPSGSASAVGSATGGTARIVALGAPIVIDDQLTMSANGASSGGAVHVGVDDNGATPGTLTLGTVDLGASGANGGTHGSIAIENASSAVAPSITMTSLTALASGSGAGAPAQGFLASNANGNRTVVDGPATITTGGNAAFTAGGAGGFTSTGALALVAGGTTTVSHTGNTGNAPTVRGASVDIDTGAFLGEPGSVVLGDTTLAIDATAGSITASVLRATSGAVTLNATGDVTVNDDISHGTGGVTARGNNVTLNARGNLVAALVDARAGDATVVAVGTLGAPDTHATRNIVLTSSGQAVTVGRAVADTGSATLSGGSAAVINGPVTAATRIDARAGQVAVNGTMRAADIAFDSAGIAVSSGARVGFTGTTRTVTFTNRTGATTIGGADATGYSVSAAEIARVESDTIRVVAPGAATLATLTLRGANAPAGGLTNVTANGLFEVQATGDLAVNGPIAVQGAAAGTRLTLGGANVNVTTPTSSLALTDSAGGPTGVLTLTGGRVTVATSTVGGALAGAANIDARDTLLGDLGGPTSDGGFVTAGQIVFNIANGLYIQNTGLDTPFDDRRGFTAGTGGITINNTGSNPAEVVINGRQATATGGFILGTDLDDVIAFTGGTIAAGSTVNGCVIGQLCRINAADADLDPIQDIADFTGSATSQLSFEVPLVELSELSLYSFAPPIDDPITGSGNEDLWVGSEPCGVTGKPPCPK